MPRSHELYESVYHQPNRFSFGRNWQDYLNSLTPSRIKAAEASLVDWLGSGLKGKTFVDIGCGSGLFSLAAYRLGAKSVVSVDVDQFSLDCARELRQREGAPAHWEVSAGSALDPKFLKTLGKFDIVYSWGVLHHTGDMDQALTNVSKLVGKDGQLFIALYNDNHRVLEGTSAFWLRAKQFYNSGSNWRKRAIEAVYTVYYIIGLVFNGINPVNYIKNYDSLRGMSFFIDIRDWLGGLPYEYATTQSIIDFFAARGFDSQKVVKARSIGCNEFLFRRHRDHHE